MSIHIELTLERIGRRKAREKRALQFGGGRGRGLRIEVHDIEIGRRLIFFGRLRLARNLSLEWGLLLGLG